MADHPQIETLLTELERIGREHPDAPKTAELKRRFRAARRTRKPFHLSLEEFDEVVRWKLESQIHRTAHHRRAITARAVEAVTRAAFEIRSRNQEFETAVRMGVLTALPGVGAPVASAILSLVEPKRYAVIDFRVWRRLFPDEKRSFGVADYCRFMQQIRPLAAALGWEAQRVDWCLWHYDVERQETVPRAGATG